MFYRLLADGISTVHLLLMLYVIVGQVVILLGLVFRWRWIRNPWFRWTHMAAILTVAAEALLDINCPLTDWEEGLRRLAQEQTDQRSFTARLVHALLFPNLPGVNYDFLTYCYYGFAGLVVLSFLLAPPGRPAPAGQVAVKLVCAAPGTEAMARTRSGHAVAEVTVGRPAQGACTETVVCPMCREPVGISVKSRRRFWAGVGLLALGGAALTALGFFWPYAAAALWGGSPRHTVWPNTVAVIGLILIVLAPSGILIRNALLAANSAAPAGGRGRHKVCV